jgi:hypothetical protein
MLSSNRRHRQRPGVECLEDRQLLSTIYALTAPDAGVQRLLAFDHLTPGTIGTRTPVTGLAPGQELEAIDFRPATGQLLGLALDTGQGTGDAQLYRINPTSGAAIAVGGLFSGQDIHLTGREFGFDVNPVTDQVHVVSDADENFRVDPNTGVVIDGDPATPGTQMDHSLFFNHTTGNPRLVALAFSHNNAGAGATTAWAIHHGPVGGLGSADYLVGVGGFDAPLGGSVGPETGAVGLDSSTGLLSDSAGSLGLDIRGSDTTAFAAFRVADAAALYSMDVTGHNAGATLLGTIGGGSDDVRDIAVALPGYLRFSTEQYTTLETGVRALISVQREGGSDGAISVDCRVGGGTATPGADFQPFPGVLHWADGDTSVKTFSVPIRPDPFAENPEFILLRLENPTGGAAIRGDTARLTLLDAPPPHGFTQDVTPLVHVTLARTRHSTGGRTRLRLQLVNNSPEDLYGPFTVVLNHVPRQFRCPDNNCTRSGSGADRRFILKPADPVGRLRPGEAVAFNGTGGIAVWRRLRRLFSQAQVFTGDGPV